jgi:putative transposase
MSVAVGLWVMGELLQAELAAKVGPKGKHDPDRTACRHGSAPGSVVLGSRRMPVDRPRQRGLEEGFTVWRLGSASGWRGR